MFNWADKAQEEHQGLLHEAELDRLARQARNRRHDRARRARRSRHGIRDLSMAKALGLVSG